MVGFPGEAAAGGGRPGPRLARSCRPPRTAPPPPPSPPAGGPHPSLRPQGDLDPQAQAERDLGSTPTSKSQTRSQPEARGEAAAGASERKARRTGPAGIRGREPRPCIRPPRNNGRRGCGSRGGRGGAGALGRWKPRPSAGALTTRAGPRRPLPAPQRPAPGGARARALPPRRCTAAARSAERGRGPRPGALPPAFSRRYEPGTPGGLRPPRAHLRTLNAPQPVRARVTSLPPPED